jgi:hypothetical protein
MKTISILIEEANLSRAEKLKPFVSRPGVYASRADVLRLALESGLRQMELANERGATDRS